MAVIALPTGITFEADWRPREAVQVNRSAWGNKRSVFDLDNSYFVAIVSIIPVAQESKKRLVRAFRAQLRGAANTFQLPVTACNQHGGSNPTVASGGAVGATTVTLSAAIGLVKGQYLTIPQASGAKQLVILTADMSGAVATFEPPLRLAATTGATVESLRPYGLAAMADGAGEPEVSQGVMTWAFEAEEAF